MPLDADDEARVIDQLHALDDRVRSPRHVLQAAAQTVDGLVVEAVHVDLQRAEDAGESRAILHLPLMHRRAPGPALEDGLGVIERRARLARNVLMEAPAEGDVEHLQAGADWEARGAGPDRPTR